MCELETSYESCSYESKVTNDLNDIWKDETDDPVKKAWKLEEVTKDLTEDTIEPDGSVASCYSFIVTAGRGGGTLGTLGSFRASSPRPRHLVSPPPGRGGEGAKLNSKAI